MALVDVKTKQLSVAAIKKGTVIDHISPGKALKLIELLKLAEKNEITVGMNLPSQRMGAKDIIKVEGWELDSDQTSKIAIFSPKATIALIQNYEVVDKYTVHLPESISEGVICPNSKCITNHEPCSIEFSVREYRKAIWLKCRFCERSFNP